MAPALICGFCMQNSDFWTRITSLYGSQTWSVVLCMQNSVISTGITSLYGTQPSSLIFAGKTVWFAPEWQVYMSSSPYLRFFFMQNSDFRTRLTNLYWSHTSSVVLSTHNSVFSTRIKRLYGFQPSPVVSCMQINDFNTRMASLYGFELSSLVLFMQNSDFKTNVYWSKPSSVVFACKTATFGPAYKSLWVPDITCRFVHAKQRDEQLNYLSLCVLALICGFCMQKIAFWTRITGLHGSQTSSVVFAFKTATFGPAYKSLWVPDLTRRFVLAKQRV